MNVKEFLELVVPIATLISTIYGVMKFKRQKQYENAQKTFEEFYIPAMKILENQLYNKADFASASFSCSKKEFKELLKDKYIYIPFVLQEKWNCFLLDKQNKRKSYLKFCNCFFENYQYYSRICKMKQITIFYRNRNKLYCNLFHQIWVNIERAVEIISLSLLVASLWIIALYIIMGIANTSFVV